MHHPALWFVISYIFLSISSCTPIAESDFYESEGVISIRAENGNFDNDWKPSEYPISTPLKLTSSGRSSISFRFYLQSPGNYSLWMLSSVNREQISDSNILVSVSDDNGFLQFQGSFAPENTEHLIWNRLEDESSFIEFTEPGFYEISVEFKDYPGFLFEKLHLTKNNNHPPTGYGLPETTEPDTDPVLMKRQQPVMIPPAWAFGLMIWSEDDDEDIIESFMAEDIWVDAVINRPKSSQAKIDLPQRWMDSKRIFSANIVDNSGEEFIPDELVASDNRPFLLSGMQNLDDPDFKKLPAKWINFMMDHSSGQIISEVLKQRIEMVADPGRAESEAPFVSVGVDHLIAETSDEDIPDEILLRWIQFSALTGKMHLYLPPNSSSEPFSAGVMQGIREMTQLRSRLFPYLYSLAHLVRAKAENPVRGDGEHTTQFQLGEAFLVAPVYREGDDNRSVWFPEGTWYNYWSGERFEGRQTWLTDAPENEIPLFVKAGSIIPYRSRAGQIMAESNRGLTIEIYAGGVGTFRLYEDDGVTNRYRSGELATTGFRYFETDGYATFTIGRTAGTYEQMPKERSLTLKFLHIKKPDQVIANTSKLQEGSQESEWMYNEGDKTLTIRWNQLTELKTDFEIRF